MPRPRSGERIRGPYHDRSRDRWRTDEIAENGQRRTVFHASESIAEKYVELWNAGKNAEERTTETAIGQYERFLKAKGNKPSSIERTLWSLRHFFPEVLPLSSLKPARCKGLYDSARTRPKVRWVDGRRVQPDEGEPLSADSHRAALKEAKSFLRWCVEQGWLVANPAEGVKPIGKLRPRGKSLGKAGIKLRIAEARAWYAKALELADLGDTGAVAALCGLELGLRAGEIACRRVRDLDTDVDDGDVLHVEGRKNGEDLSLPIGATLRPHLLRLAEGRDPERYLFELRPPSVAHPAGTPRTRWWVRAQVHRVCDAAGVPRVTAHALRGLLATLLLERGAALADVAGLLGHDPKVTQEHYAAPGAADLGARRAGLKVLAGGRAR